MITYSARSTVTALGCILLPLFIGLLGSGVTISNIPGWYASLSKPWFSPPNWLFGPVWTILYILMGLSLYLIIKDGITGRDTKYAVGYFGAQLIMNLLWSYIFFGFHSPTGGVVVIIILILLILATIHSFRRINQNAAFLLLPYLCWTGFAMILNLTIMTLNW